jgi:hypothetical protein
VEHDYSQPAVEEEAEVDEPIEVGVVRVVIQVVGQHAV